MASGDPVKLRGDDGELDAELEIEAVERVHVTVRSRGGKKGSREQRNPDYNAALLLLLERMALLGAVLEDVVVVSDRAMRNYPNAGDRRLPLDFPFDLAGMTDLEPLRLKICRSQMGVARASEVKDERKGNPTRAIRLEFSSIGNDLDSPSVARVIREGI